jgi:hypothetical protein
MSEVKRASRPPGLAESGATGGEVAPLQPRQMDRRPADHSYLVDGRSRWNAPCS